MRRRLSTLHSRLARPQALHHGARVAQAAADLVRAAVGLDQLELEGAEVSALVDVRHGAHQWTQDDLGMVLEEVDL